MISVSVAGIQKNRCRQQYPERMVETLAQLPFIGDQVGLFRAQAGRPKRRSGARFGNEAAFEDDADRSLRGRRAASSENSSMK